MTDSAPPPIVTMIRRELLTSLRSWKSFILLVLLLLLLLYAAAQTMEASVMYTTASRAMTQFFQFQIWCLYLVAMTIVPAMAAVSINSERETGNWDLLATTLIPPTRIVTGKYIAVLVYFTLFCVAVLPLTGLVYFYAGVDVYRFFDAALWIVPAALCNAAMGIWASHTCAKTAQAIIRTFGMIVITGALYAIAFTTDQYLRRITGTGLGLDSLLTLLPPALASPTALFGLYQFILGIFFFGLTLFATRERVSPVMASARTAAVALERTRARLFSPPLLRVPDGGNPFGFRDVYGSPMQKRSVAFSMAILFALVYFGLFGFMANFAGGSEAGIGIIERIVMLALVPPLVAIAIVKEREETTLDMYRVTLRSGTDLLVGKVLGVLRQWKAILLTLVLCKLVVAAMIVIGALPYDDYVSSWVAFIDLITLPVHLLLVIVTALVGATFPKTTIAAIGAASGCVFAGALFFLYLQVQVMMDGPAGDETTTVVVFLLSHLLLSGVFLLVGAAIAVARMTTLWEARE